MTSNSKPTQKVSGLIWRLVSLGCMTPVRMAEGAKLGSAAALAAVILLSISSMSVTWYCINEVTMLKGRVEMLEFESDDKGNTISKLLDQLGVQSSTYQGGGAGEENPHHLHREVRQLDLTAIIVQIVRDELEAQSLEPGPKGDPGPSGPPGPQGETGDHGAKGDKGEQGQQGYPGFKGQEGERGEMGKDGLQGVRGERGEKGDMGTRGPVGEKGERGDTGLVGLKGEKGEKGHFGYPGYKGQKGELGEQGVQGPIGERGKKGDIGPQGPSGGEKGEQGDTGVKGESGEKGNKGDHGHPGYGQKGLKGEVGDQGTRGPTGRKGEKGDVGPRGPSGGEKGERGDTGQPGLRGLKGEKGQLGYPGYKGNNGTMGLQGDKGSTGEKGERGDTGLQGPRGERGHTGLSGSIGAKGEKGQLGHTGYKGQKGEVGETGEKGSQGALGPVGEPGARGPLGGRGERGEKGDMGTRGHVGKKGERGDPGLSGLKGEEGNQGIPGVQGEKGEPGQKGEKGDTRIGPHLCGGTSGWARVANLDMTIGSHQCPGDMVEVILSGKRLCGRTGSAARSCVSAKFSTTGLQYSEVCGRITGYQHAPAAAFFYTHRQSIDSWYVDGVSVTHGPPGSREHVWTFVTGINEDGSGVAPSAQCPCTPTASGVVVPPFVGQDYFCESGVTSGYAYVLHPNDPLWDGDGCFETGNTCCEFNSPPYFTKQLSSSTSNDLEVRACGYRSRSASFEPGDTLIELIELYIK